MTTVDEDEGLLQLEGVVRYLRPLAKADEEDQLTGDFEALCVVEECYDSIMREYACHFCRTPIKDKQDRYCSKSCSQADMEGM
jgi:hypothetical protein